MKKKTRKPKPKKVLSKFYEVPVPFYKCHVVLAIEATTDEIVQWGIKHKIDEKSFSKEWRDCLSDLTEGSDCAGICMTYGDNNPDLLIALKKRPTNSAEYGVLYHEISHVVDSIAVRVDADTMLFNKRGMSEPRAYLFEYIITAFNRMLWK